MNFFNLIKPFSENAEQQKVVNYLKTYHPNVLFTTGLLGMKLSHWQGWLLRTLGYANGTPDLMIFKPNHIEHGLFIEMKRPKRSYIENGITKIIPEGKVSENQKEFLKRLRAEGYVAVVAFGADECIDIIENYMKE
jgi:hypothetical protein